MTVVKDRLERRNKSTHNKKNVSQEKQTLDLALKDHREEDNKKYFKK